jgi:hypothetical protein
LRAPLPFGCRSTARARPGHIRAQHSSATCQFSEDQTIPTTTTVVRTSTRVLSSSGLCQGGTPPRPSAADAPRMPMLVGAGCDGPDPRRGAGHAAAAAAVAGVAACGFFQLLLVRRLRLTVFGWSCRFLTNKSVRLSNPHRVGKWTLPQLDGADCDLPSLAARAARHHIP